MKMQTPKRETEKERKAPDKPGKDGERTESAPALNFLQGIITDDLRTKKFDGRVNTRFPPEPNGYLHIGHAKSICLNFGLAAEYGGLCNLRFDDTNPTKEEVEFVESIKADVRWLGFDWDDREYYASDYFEQLYQWAERLIKAGKAYVCSLTADQIREYRGTLTQPGKDSPYRNRTVEENLDLFRRMREGGFQDGAHVLRAKIDMASPNLNMRDPIMYRILKASHHRTGDKWCIYPMYDWAHGQSDSIERITHSICTLEFENHRPLYDWYLDALGIYHPQQIEFARLNLNYTVMSKRRFIELVRDAHVRGWDDPRMPTIAGFRRRGYTPEAIRNFCKDVGVSKFNGVIDIGRLENALREDLNKRAPRVLAVLRPLRVVIDNYPEGQSEELEAINNPEDPAAGTRKVPFSRVLYIERDDFREDPPKQFFRLTPGREVRLRYAYFITCTNVIKDERTGEVVELHCTYDPATRGGNAPDGRKVKGTIHWVSAEHALEAEVRLYDHLFSKPDPDDLEEGQTYIANLNPKSLEVLTSCRVEPSVAGAAPGRRYQFERQGYFSVDPDSSSTRLVFNRTVSLTDTWAKIEKAQTSKTRKRKIIINPTAKRDTIEKEVFGKTVTDTLYAELAGDLAHDAEVIVSFEEEVRSEGRVYPIVIRTKGSLHSAILRLERGVIHCHEMKVVDEKQRQGHGRRIFTQLARTAADLGFTELRGRLIRFSGSKRPDLEGRGYYAFARYGFDAPVPDAVRQKLPEALEAAKNLSDLMRTDAGRKAWEKEGVTVNARFDLQPGSASWSILENG
jgi:glutaminyl-tRNA synthetase